MLLSLLAAFFAALLFAAGLPGEFVFDDIPNIVNNNAIQLTQLNFHSLLKTIATPQISGDMRGLPTLTFAIDYWRGNGADPATFKTTNIVIHALTVLALAGFFRKLLPFAGISDERAKWIAPALALMWAVHPLQVSSVLYVVQRLQTMGTLFLTLALLAYVKAREAQIQGRPSRIALMLTVLFWVLALDCKEDSIQLPAFTLALELTVLRFRAANARLARGLRIGYAIACGAGAMIYLFWILPHFWEWSNYPGRNFSSAERLLTEARILCMYVWQTIIPVPWHMPFYYDWVEPSRGLLRPWTTLPAIALILGLLGIAWKLKTHWPLFSLGIFLFFGSHFVTANVIGLELAFEHRNSFALVGAVLAIGSLLAHANQRLRSPPAAQAIACVLLLAALASLTTVRAYAWRSNLTMSKASTEAAPHSARAWIQLCAAYFKLGGGPTPKNPYLDGAIQACSSGASSAPYALNNLALLVVLKTVRGDVSQQDWQHLQQRLATMQLSWDNRRAILILINHEQMGVKLNRLELLKAMGTLDERTMLDPFTLSQFGYFIMNDLHEPDLAIPYFVKAIAAIPPNDPFPAQLAAELKEKGRPDLAQTIERFGTTRILPSAQRQ
ncbi:MAG: hypothetical protein JSR70_08030 [Proteobacteria bacterium]|nr:hypothetical protein [Pseudomonadota bacterium]